jgi:hypothetical protein
VLIELRITTHSFLSFESATLLYSFRSFDRCVPHSFEYTSIFIQDLPHSLNHTSIHSNTHLTTDPNTLLKMLAKSLILAATLQATLTTAIGNAIIANRCPYDIWLWNVVEGVPGAPIHVPARSRHSEPYASLAALKVSKTDQLIDGQQTQFEYSTKSGKLWYNISFVNCAKGESAADCPGHDMGLAIDSPDQSCAPANCAGGSYCPTQAYYVDQPLIKLGIEEPVFVCGTEGAEMDLYMKICSNQAELKRSVAGRVEVVEG